MQAAEIRERFLSFFEQREHRRMPSASLVPPSHDQSVLLTTAGMQPFKPYFRGEEQPPQKRLTSCQKCFRTPDIDSVGTTARHLTFFEMLGNFSIGDYFKQGAVEFARELSVEGFGLDEDRIWITVFGGDEGLGLGPDEEAIECWRAVGFPDERIVRLPRSENYWQAGATGPSGPSSELYFDRGLDFGGADDRPGDDTERFLEFWNLVFMQYELAEDGSLSDLPQRNIDAGLGLDRLAAILEDVPSVYETGQFRPLVELGEDLSGRRYGEDQPTTRALRILADHGRGAAFLIADGVVPSNEDRGYVLRRVLRRAIQQGRVLGIEGGLLPALTARAVETMGEAYPDLHAEADTIARWAAAEEEGFLATLEHGERLLGEIVARADEAGSNAVSAEDAFKLHDTYGFPFELTRELLADQGLTVDEAGFEALMEGAREVARAGGRHAAAAGDDSVREFVLAAGPETRFVGYETTERDTVIAGLRRENGRVLGKLEESPFYPAGGGQISDAGVVETPSGRARVVEVFRLGDDQALALEPVEGELAEGEPAHAVVERDARLATMRNHTATHLLHAALRERLGSHVRQAGSYVGPDKLRFDFSHSERLSPEELADVERRVGEWIVEGRPVRAIETTRDAAEALGAMALFGEKYGDWVRMVEVEDVSRELCGGTHVASTGEIGIFHVTAESSSAANVRRIEAVTGEAGAELFRARTAELSQLATMLKVREPDVVAAVERLREQSKRPREPAADLGPMADELVATADDLGGLKLVTAVTAAPSPRELLKLSDTVRQRLGDAAVVLGATAEDRVHLVANFSESAVERGAKAGEVVRIAAEVAGGGGGGRDTMAQAGAKDPGKLPDAIAAARRELERLLGDGGAA